MVPVNSLSWYSFFLGLTTAFIAWLLLKAIQIRIDALLLHLRLRRTLKPLAENPLNKVALKKVDDCKRRLRLQAKLNPEWVKPLIDEIPKLVREIAELYYPSSPDPIRAPGLSHFARAIQFAVMDIADFLETRRVGRLINVSASQALRTAEMGRSIVKHPTYQWSKKLYDAISPWYKKIRPVYQTFRYSSVIMWTVLIGSNVAIRTLQPAIVDIVGRHAIRLYSGQFDNIEE